MDSENSEDWPEIGELVVASANNITHYGVYVKLDEYKKEGFLHISEISSSWVRNINNFVHEGEKIVLKVLRVNQEKLQVDLSLRRVTKSEKREKMLQWKHVKKAEGLMRSASQKLGIPFEKLYSEAWIPLQKSFGEVYEGLERTAIEGVEVLLEQGLSQELAETLASIVKEKIKTSSAKTKGILEMKCSKPDGVVQIKKALLKARNAKVPRGTRFRIYVVTPPKYRIEVTAKNYKVANQTIGNISELAIKSIIEAGGEGTFERG